jgi:hypothetical protein
MTIHAAALLASLVLLEEAAPPPGPDPLAQHVFAPDLVMRHAAEIGLDEKQRTAVKDAVIRMQSRFLDLQWDMQAESEKLAKLLEAQTVDETAVLAQADRPGHGPGAGRQEDAPLPPGPGQESADRAPT